MFGGGGGGGGVVRADFPEEITWELKPEGQAGANEMDEENGASSREREQQASHH